MNRSNRFTIRINSAEKREIEKLAQILQRSQSDAVRWLIRKTANQIDDYQIDHETRSLQGSRFLHGGCDDLS